MKIISESGKRVVAIDLIQPYMIECNGNSHIKVNEIDLYSGEYNALDAVKEINTKIEEHYSNNVTLK